MIRPKPENARNALRLLREILSEKGIEKPITQRELARAISIPVNTLKAVEAGARKLSDRMVCHIAMKIGAFWKDGKWVRISGNQIVPYTLEIFRDVEKTIIGRPRDWRAHAHFLYINLDYLFKMTPDYRWWDVRFRMEQCLQDCWKIAGIERK
jgi:transcriptional regulator with XRE-family HTH domain